MNELNMDVNMNVNINVNTQTDCYADNAGAFMNGKKREKVRVSFRMTIISIFILYCSYSHSLHKTTVSLFLSPPLSHSVSLIRFLLHRHPVQVRKLSTLATRTRSAQS